MLQVHMSPPASHRAMPPVAVTDSFGEETFTLLPVVRAVIASILHERRDQADVEDCAQEVLRRALEGHARLRPGEALRPWMLGIARHVALDHLRTRRNTLRRTEFDPPDGQEGVTPTLDRLADPSPHLDDQVDQKRRERKLRAAMDGLTEGQRKAMMMFHLEGLGYQEVADRLGVPLGTVATWISRGRRAIAAELSSESRKP